MTSGLPACLVTGRLSVDVLMIYSIGLKMDDIQFVFIRVYMRKRAPLSELCSALPVLGRGDRFSCRQIIHGDFILNEVKLLSLSEVTSRARAAPSSAASLCRPVWQSNVIPDVTGAKPNKGSSAEDVSFHYNNTVCSWSRLIIIILLLC